MPERRLAALEDLAARSMTVAEFAEVLGKIFAAVRATCPPETAELVKQRCLTGLAPMLRIDRDDLERITIFSEIEAFVKLKLEALRER